MKIKNNDKNKELKENLKLISNKLFLYLIGIVLYIIIILLLVIKMISPYNFRSGKRIFSLIANGEI